MTKQRGQSAVEFALIAPMFFLMCFGMIYAGILFMDYLQYNNAARDIARFASIEGVDRAKSERSRFINPITDLYIISDPNNTDDFNVQLINENKDVEVTINLTLNSALPKVLVDIDFPPNKLKTIRYVMPVENA